MEGMRIGAFELSQIGQFIDQLTPQNISLYFTEADEQKVTMEWVQAACCWWVRENIDKENWRVYAHYWNKSPNTMAQYARAFNLFYDSATGELHCYENLTFSHHLEVSRADGVENLQDAEELLDEAVEKGWNVPQFRERLSTGHDPKSPESKALDFFHHFTHSNMEKGEYLTKMWVDYCESEGWPIVEWVMGRPAKGERIDEREEEENRDMEFVAR